MGKEARERRAEERRQWLLTTPAGRVEDWLTIGLRPTLAAAGATEQEVDLIVEDVDLRVRSLYRHLPKIGSTLLLPAYEEAVFHRPTDVPEWVRAFTITAVRNSAIEELHAGDRLADRLIVELTTSASMALATIDSDKAAAAFNAPMAGDPFDGLEQRFPTAWAAMWHLGHSWEAAGQEIRYRPVDTDPVAIPEAAVETVHLESVERQSTRQLTVILNGVDPRFDTQLVRMLELIDTGELGALFAPSFKHLSRNMAKLYQLLDVVLTRGAPVVTPNYYLTDGLVAARRLLCRPVQESAGFLTYCRDLEGVAPVHADALSHFVDSTGDDATPRPSGRRQRLDSLEDVVRSLIAVVRDDPPAFDQSAKRREWSRPLPPRSSTAPCSAHAPEPDRARPLRSPRQVAATAGALRVRAGQRTMGDLLEGPLALGEYRTPEYRLSVAGHAELVGQQPDHGLEWHPASREVYMFQKATTHWDGRLGEQASDLEMRLGVRIGAGLPQVVVADDPPLSVLVGLVLEAGLLHLEAPSIRGVHTLQEEVQA